MKLPLPLVALAVCPLLWIAMASTEDYQGADAILKHIPAPVAPAGSAEAKAEARRNFHADLKLFRERADTLPPVEAATEWLALFTRAKGFPSVHSPVHQTARIPQINAVFEALPPPAAWDALGAQIATLPEPEAGSLDFSTPALRMIAAALQQRPDDVRQALDALSTHVQTIDAAHRASAVDLVDLYRGKIFPEAATDASALAEFEARLQEVQRQPPPPNPPSATSFGIMPSLPAQWRPPPMPNPHPATGAFLETQWNANKFLDASNLVRLAGPERAEALLKEILAFGIGHLSITDPATRALARKVATGMIGELKFAPWDVIELSDSDELYDLLDERFPLTKKNAADRQQAEGYHGLSLIVRGKAAEAAAHFVKVNAMLSDNPDPLEALRVDHRSAKNTIDVLVADGHAQQVFAFYDALLAEHPALPYWDSYTTAAIRAGEADAMLARVQETSERPGLAPDLKSQLQLARADGLLAADHVAEAVTALREIAAAQARAAEAAPRGPANTRQELSAIIKLTGIARVTRDAALLAEQVDTIIRIAKLHPTILDYLSVGSDDSLNTVFLAANRGPAMEGLLAGVLAQAETAAMQTWTRDSSKKIAGQEIDSALVRNGPLPKLVDLYYRAERFDDIVTLLDDGKSWGAGTLAELLGNDLWYGSKRNFFYQVARALQKTGHTDAALQLTNAFLERYGSSDPAYALLLELLPPDRAEARLDELFRADQFEERPLIWRARLQFDLGRLDDAERSARQAIGIDPSDGKQGRGDRMRAWAVLGDVLERKGDQEKAAGMRQAVKAIRLSEDADRLHAVGLLSRAIETYEKALGYFADAYCIQSRLAVQLAAAGKLDEALPHYQRAFELMPESFGRLESHCFGCERTFTGKPAQGTAERVFKKFVEEQPDNPRVHYLLGYLRYEQERKPEAAVEFRAAVKLDPDYINAWAKLAEASEDPTDQGDAALNLLRLDPQRRHHEPSLVQVNGLRALWAAVEAENAFLPARMTELYPLAASRQALAKARAGQADSPDEDEAAGAAIGLQRRHPPKDAEHPFLPQDALRQNRVIDAALQFLAVDHPAGPGK